MIKFLNFLNNWYSIIKITQSSLPYGIIFYFMILLNLIFLFIEINLSKKIFGMINYSFFLQQKFYHYFISIYSYILDIFYNLISHFYQLLL